MSVAVIIGLLPAMALGIDAGKAFDDPELQARYEDIIAEVRCVKCQNQSIKDSNALIASDLRREIRRMIEDGRTNDEIYDFLVARYGDFVLYRPRATGKTLFLWLAPAVFLLAGAAFLVQILRRRMSLPNDNDEGSPA
jgi:cytochrome c-type biogenesis protein CcmH